MSTLGLNDYQTLPPLEPDLPTKPKSAATALLLSLVLPGAGQIYAKSPTAGKVTCAFFFFSVLFGAGSFLHNSNVAGWSAVYVAASLYIFAFLDAYFAALEYNQGISPYLIGSNPRIACILNFLTNGIGYFYLGDRGKGILMFLGFAVVRRVVAQAAGNPFWFDYAWIVLQAVLAFDAYRVARRRLLESFPQLANHSWRAASSGQLTPAVPISLALVIVLPLLGLIGLGGIAQNSGDFNPAALEVESTPQGALYTDKKLGLKFILPDGWEMERRQDTTAFHANDRSGECKIVLLRNFSILSAENFQRSMERQLAHNKDLSVYGHAVGTLGTLPAALMRIGVGTKVTEQIATAKIGLVLYTLIGVANSDNEACPAQLDQIRSSFTAKQ